MSLFFKRDRKNNLVFIFSNQIIRDVISDMPNKQLLFTNFFKNGSEQLSLHSHNNKMQFQSYFDMKSGKIVLHSNNVCCMMCLEKTNKLEFVDVSNEFITNLYNYYRNEFRTKIIDKPLQKLFKDMNDFRDRVEGLETDFYQKEDQIPNYFRNILDYNKRNLLLKWSTL